jgi:hypothetical protein
MLTSGSRFGSLVAMLPILIFVLIPENAYAQYRMEDTEAKSIGYTSSGSEVVILKIRSQGKLDGDVQTWVKYREGDKIISTEVICSHGDGQSRLSQSPDNGDDHVYHLLIKTACEHQSLLMRGMYN